VRADASVANGDTPLAALMRETAAATAYMLKLAQHIRQSKATDFEPSQFVDHYEEAVVEMLEKKQAGLPVSREHAAPRPQNVANLMDSLRRSIAQALVRRTQANSVRTFLRLGSAVDRSDAVSNGNKTCTPRTADDTAPILVPDGAGIWTFGDHLRHHRGCRHYSRVGG
jgi:hypothetical protein